MADRMTSYERVYHALFATPTCKRLWKEAIESLDKIKIESVSWVCRTTEDTARAVPVFQLTGDRSWNGEHLSHSEISAREVMPDTVAREIIKVHFGSDKDVKTFNCSADIVLSGGTVSRKTSYGREKVYQSDFHDFLLDKFREKASDAIKDVNKRLKQACKDMQDTPAFRQSQREALVGFCKDALTKALLPWHEMEQSVLEEAWDQFICTAIMRN